MAKKIIVTVTGFSVIVIGIVMIVTPGPAIIVIPAGLGILAIEFAWARRWLRRIKAYTRTISQRAKRHRREKKHPHS
ncbi:MAG: PGPGW domain-containing protein [Verrucomicrobiota bacterium]